MPIMLRAIGITAGFAGLYPPVNSALFRLPLVVAALLCSPGLHAQVMSDVATLAQEATIYEDLPTSNGGGYGLVCAGNLDSAGSTRRSFARYDLPDIPAGSTITRVQMSLRQVRVRGMGSGSPKSATLEVRQVNGSWEEGTGSPRTAACGGGGGGGGVSWDSAPAVKANSGADVDMNNGNSQAFAIDTDVGAADDGLIADVQAWVDGAENNGWRFRVSEEGTIDNARLIELLDITIDWTEPAAEPDFLINAGLNDAWFNAATAGQGFFIIVFPDIGLVFLSWFTYDTERPDASVEAILGEAGHRWLTAQGPYEGDTASLDLVLTTGGVFDSADPAVENDASYGTISIVWHDCENATLTYNIPSLALIGSIELNRITLDNVGLCEALKE